MSSIVAIENQKISFNWDLVDFISLMENKGIGHEGYWHFGERPSLERETGVSLRIEESQKNGCNP